MRHPYDEAVVSYMTRDLEVAHADTPIEEIARTMQGRGISGLPVVDGRHNLVGVVTRTDLISLGLLQAGRRPTNRAMPLPHRRASDLMTRDPASVDSSVSLRDAAELMTDRQYHRVFVTEGGKLAGVICAIDFTAAVRDAKTDLPVSTIMTSPIVSVDVQATLGETVELLDRIHVTGLIVTDEGQPIGMFTQTDALLSRDLPRSTPIEMTYDAAVICLPSEMKLFRVAAHVADMRVRRVVVCKAREPVGIVTTSDFARLVALS
jgi:CBS domain-containing protein